MIRIREVRLDDAEAIQRINSDSLQYDFPVEDTRNQLAKIMRSPHAVLLVAEDDADVLGYIQLSDYENTYHHSLKNLITLATSPKYQRMGVGARLLQAGEEWAKANGAKGIRLVSVCEQNRETGL